MESPQVEPREIYGSWRPATTPCSIWVLIWAFPKGETELAHDLKYKANVLAQSDVDVFWVVRELNRWAQMYPVQIERVSDCQMQCEY